MAEPSAPARARLYGWLWLVVALQVAIPASYYFVREDRDDERFAWRMFSATRVKKCDIVLREQQAGTWAKVDMTPLLHASWRNSLKRGRKRVIERLLETRCAEPGRDAVELVRRCKNSRGEKLEPERTRLGCATGSFERGGR